jgi:hypothetical protein
MTTQLTRDSITTNHLLIGDVHVDGSARLELRNRPGPTNWSGQLCAVRRMT